MRAWLGVVLVAGGAMIAACSGAANGPTSPSAAAGGEVAAAPTLVAEPTVGRFSTLVVRTARFQLSESSAFTTITDEGTATGAVNGLITYTVQRAQGAGRRIYWRTRAGVLAGAVTSSSFDGALTPQAFDATMFT